MRDRWFSRMGCMRLGLAERGLLATLYDLGDIIHAPWLDIDEIMGPGWKIIADNLSDMGYLIVNYSNGWFRLEINYPDKDRRRYLRNLKRAKKDAK